MPDRKEKDLHRIQTGPPDTCTGVSPSVRQSEDQGTPPAEGLTLGQQQARAEEHDDDYRPVKEAEEGGVGEMGLVGDLAVEVELAVDLVMEVELAV
jgi:hypothetical protein